MTVRDCDKRSIIINFKHGKKRVKSIPENLMNSGEIRLYKSCVEKKRTRRNYYFVYGRKKIMAFRAFESARLFADRRRCGGDRRDEFYSCLGCVYLTRCSAKNRPRRPRVPACRRTAAAMSCKRRLHCVLDNGLDKIRDGRW